MTSSEKNTSENKKRVLDLVWKNYEGQVTATRRTSDRVAVVLAASVAGIGLIFKDISMASAMSTSVRLALTVLFASLMTAFVVACRAWAPSPVGIPSGTNLDRLWHFLVAVEDDISAATLISDVCAATDEEEQTTLRIARLLRACMVLCGIAFVSSVWVKVFSGA
jgi:hypothetical protein